MKTNSVPAFALVAFTLLSGLAWAGSDLPAEAPRPAPPAARPPLDGLRLQPGDDVLRRHVPARPRTEADKQRVEATAWYMTGQIRELRTDFRGALDAYRKAVELDPQAIQAYRALIPLAFGLGETEEAIRYAVKAAELDPNDYRLLRQLGAEMIQRGSIPVAIQLFEQAARSKTIDKQSEAYVVLMRDLALLYQATGKHDQAADAFQVVFDARTSPDKYKLDAQTRRRLEADPKSSFEEIGEAFLAARRTDLAIRAFELAAKERDGKPGTLNYNLARVYFQTGRHDEALAELQKYFDAELQSNGRDAYQLLADVLKAVGKSDELVSRLETLAKSDSRNAVLQLFLADQYLAAERLDEAEAAYKRVLETSSDPGAHLGLAGVHRRREQAENWFAAVLKVMKDARNPQQLEENLGRLEAEVAAVAEDGKFAAAVVAHGRTLVEGERPQLEFAGSLILAKVAAGAQDGKAATDFYRFALKSRPAGAAVVAAMIYEEFGQHLLDAGQHAEAAKVFQEAARDPALERNRAGFLFRLAQAHELAGDTPAALAAIQEAQRMLPDVGLLQYQEAWIYYHSGQWDEAIPRFEEVIEKFPQEKRLVRQCQFSLSNIYVQKGDIGRGEKILEEVYKEEPDDPSVNNDLGYLYADQGKNLEQAERMIRKALAAEPENPAYLDSMGWVLYKLGRHDEALPHLQKAVGRPGGGDATIWDHLGDCYDRLEKPEKAREAWQKALEDAKKASRRDEELIERVEKKLKSSKGE